jgi:phage terminase small subunit
MVARRTSDAAKQARGTFTPTRRKAEPRYEPSAPKMPPGLPKDAQKHWRRLVPELARAKVLARIDGDALALYCIRVADLYATWAKKWTASDIAQFRMLLSEFGMTPASRLRAPPLVEDLTPIPTPCESNEAAEARAIASGKLVRMSQRLATILKASSPGAPPSADSSG